MIFDVSWTAQNLKGIIADGYVEMLVTKDPEDTMATIALCDFQVLKRNS